MLLRTLQYSAASSWSGEFPAIDSPSTLLIVFGARRFLEDRAPVDELRRQYPQAVIVGCSTSGEVLGDQILDESLTVAIARFDSTQLRSITAEIAAHESSKELGSAVASGLVGDGLRGVMVFSDGLAVNGTELVAGIAGELGDEVVITGGLAGDADRFECTWVLGANGEPRTGYVSAVGLYGDRVRIGHGSRGGWDTFGPEREITRSSSNVLYELDGRPALDLYKEYLGDRAEGLPATGLLFPLAIRQRAGDEKQLVRTILAVDDETRSMTFAGDVPKGWRAQLMKANFDRLVDGAASAAQIARREDENGMSMLAIAVSCVGRRLVLGERAEEEVEAALDELPEGTEMVGFYSYGEISPSVDGQCDLHNQTMTLTTIQED
ncbi:MAG: FIST C-terminal domain-containing protein [bacterium]|nr:FIST C-terminal domain-containing protein [bacterium]